MAQKIAKQIFIGMDTDTTDRLMEQGSYRGALNVHVGTSEGSDSLSVETVKGNTLVSYSLPIGINKIIGSHEDIINKCVYYFLYNEYTIPNLTTYGGSTVTIQNNSSQPSGIINSDIVRISPIVPDGNKWIVQFPGNGNVYRLINPRRFIDINDDSGYSGSFSGTGTITRFKHAILKYDSISNTISTVLQHSRLNFDIDHCITGTSLINGILSWTDDYNPPRSLRLSDASSYNSFFVESEIDFIRTPPSEPVIISTFNDAALTNYMNNKSYQFIYRYVYKDNSRSVWSGMSELVPTGYAEAKKNKINIIIQNQETTNFILYSKIISNIEIAFRDSDTFNFKYIDRIAFPSSTTNAIYTFLNDRNYPVISSDDTSHLFESIPNIVGTLSSVRNRIFVGDCLEGMDVDPTSFSAGTITYITKTVPDKNVLGFKSSSIYDIGVVFFDRAQRKSGVYKLNRISTEQQMFDGTGVKRLVGAQMSFTLSGKPPIGATRYQIVKSKNLLKSFFLQGTCIVIATSSSPSQESKIKFNALNGKITYVPTAGDFIVFINPVNNFTSFPVKYKVLRAEGDIIVVEGIAPTIFSAGVQTYAFQYCEIFTQTLSDNLYYEISQSYPVLSPHTAFRRFGSDNLDTGKNIILSSGDISVRNLDDSYIYYSSVTIKITNFTFPNITVPVSITLNGLTITVDASVDSPKTASSIANEFVAVINTKNTNIEAIFIADVFDGFYAPVVYNEFNAAIFIVKTKTKGSASSVSFNTSSAHVIFLTSVSGSGAQSVINNSVFECMSPTDDSFEEWNKNIGRPNEVLTQGDKEVRRSTIVRYGENYINGTNINNIASFASLSQQDMPNSGTIKKLIVAANNQAEGTVLLCVQENEINSLYIGQTMIKNAGGGENLAVTDDVIGTVNPLQKLVGTINPESVVQHNGIVYGFDALRGIVWRYGQDGLNFLSDVGMKNFFYTRSAYLLSLGSFKCFAGIDPFHEEYILSVPNADSSQTTVAWSEKTNRWTSFRSFIPEWMQKINTKFLTFLNGQLWVHNSSTYNNFYGTQYTSKMRLICNQEPDNVKILQMIEEVAQGGHWNSPEINTPEGQSSELIGLFDIANPSVLPADFRNYEGKYVGMVMRDKNTPNMIPTDYPLLRGDVIRSQVFDIILERLGTTKANLFMVNLGYIDSYKTTR